MSSVLWYASHMVHVRRAEFTIVVCQYDLQVIRLFLMIAWRSLLYKDIQCYQLKVVFVVSVTFFFVFRFTRGVGHLAFECTEDFK